MPISSRSRLNLTRAATMSEIEKKPREVQAKQQRGDKQQEMQQQQFQSQQQGLKCKEQEGKSGKAAATAAAAARLEREWTPRAATAAANST
ncbi:hypothetical protein PoB_005610700 [Plakobranchus ocellatus]|uniref:Small EDRK-rich factor-like N-terminal domain-containing protein n=1 Tax=Plakobranchus ocellatus TaxID=259542 RepID=A0AAV4CE39_9GAST|nr:hypothetical protein PoB_005610700 [Plakobranchus ocellatus]